jgi:TolA-binding protein
MLAALAVSFLLCLSLGYVLTRAMPPKGAPLRYPAIVRGLWKVSLVATIALASGYAVQRHADAQQSDLEYRIDELQSHIDDLEGQVSDLDDQLEKTTKLARSATWR